MIYAQLSQKNFYNVIFINQDLIISLNLLIVILIISYLLLIYI